MNPKRLRSFIIGSYLGDGTIPKSRSKNSNCYLQIQHSEKQFEYLKWKSELLGDFGKEPILVKRTLKNKPYTYAMLTTKVHPFCTRLRKLYVGDQIQKKTINNSVISYLDELGLAIWYMDDGNLSYRKKKRKDGSTYKYIGGVKLCTCSFSIDECNLLIDLLKRKWNLESKIYLTKGKYPIIWLNSTNTKKFIKIIEQFVPDCMKYKIDIKREVPK